MATNPDNPSDCMKATAPSGIWPKMGRTLRRCPVIDAGQQSAHAGPEKHLRAAERDEESRAQQRAEKNRQADHDKIGHVRRANDRPHHLHHPLDRRLRSHQRQNVAALHNRPRADRDLLTAPRMILRRNTPCTASSRARSSSVRPTKSGRLTNTS